MRHGRTRAFSQFLLLSIVLLDLVPLVFGAGSVTVTPRNSGTNPGVTFKTKFGQVNSTNTQQYATIPGVFANGSIIFSPSGFERTIGTYTFTVNSFGNGTFQLVFYGIPPVKVSSSVAGVSYDFVRNAEIITYTTSQTSGLIIVYSGVAPNIGNAVTQGSALLIIIMLMVSVAFLIIIAFRIVPTDQEKSPLGQFILSPLGMIVIVLIFVVILALIAAFTNYFSGIGL